MTQPYKCEDELQVFSHALSEFESSQNVLDRKLKAALSQLDANFLVLEHVAGEHRKQRAEHKALSDMLKDIESRMKHRQNDSEFVASSKNELGCLKARLALISVSLDRMRAVKPRTGSLLLMLTMGRVNTKMWKKSELIQLKGEYNKYKYRSTLLFTLFAIIQCYFTVHRIFGTLHQLWMLYFYLSLAIRENILWVNGSNIKSWWIYHHYLSMLISIVVLLWPDGPDYQWFLPQSSAYLTWHGFVLMLQNYYQQHRHYVRTSLGKAKDIDLTLTETLVEKPTNLFFLVPLLFLTHALQLASGVFLMYHASSSQVMWHMLCTGLLACTIGIGNAICTITVINNKISIRKILRSTSQ